MPAIKVLLIDDEKDFVSLVSQALIRKGGFDVLTAHNGADGVTLATDKKPDIILLDITMPGEDGFAVLKRLKEHNVTVTIPVVMLTAIATYEARLEALHLYCEGYLEKPCTTEDLVNKINATIDRRRDLRDKLK
jgi:DNA-binding response OmpR family regulator